MNITIKKIEEQEMKALDDVYTGIVLHEFPEYADGIVEKLAEGKSKEDALHAFIKLGAFDESKLVGFLLADKPIGGVMFISWVGVLPEYQGKGIGTQLLEKIEKTALEIGVHNMQLQADEKNLSFYKNAGFEVLGLDKKGYFGTDNYVLKKLIQEPQIDKFFN